MLLTPRCGVGLNDLLGAKEAGKGEGLADLPKTEAAVSMTEKLTTLITVSEAGQRNTCEV